MKQSARPRSKRPAKAAASSPEAMWAILGAARALEEKLEAAVSGAGLSMAKFGVLRMLAQAGEPASLTDLASHQGCVRSNITQLIDRLEAEGLVKRVDDPTDRRSIRAALTPVGVEKQATAARAVDALQRDFSGRMSAQDRATVMRLLSALK